jgi:exodeoxyribonuclease V gamma subunit
VPLHVHRAPRTDLLAEQLAELLATPLDDPFATDVVVVPTRGMERWLSQRLSHRLGRSKGREDGVCAGVEFRSPASLVAEITGTRDDDPWSPDATVWRLLAAIDECLDEPWAHTLARHLGHGLTGEDADLRHGRRFSVAQRLARLFASYAAQRPSLIDDWSSGGSGDGVGGELPDDLAWQPELWRRLARAVSAPTPPERHRAMLAALDDDPGSFDLPERLSLFGHTRLPVTEVELLGGLGRHRDVHLWLPHPSPELWAALEPAAGSVPRSEDQSHRAAGHPLLATLGRDLRELQQVLGKAADLTSAIAPPIGRDTLLGWLQDDLRANALGDASSRSLDDRDRSVQVHACHGPSRQVEVLREVLLGLLADDPTLEPRDVLVMCPDIETYAPLITAAFGLQAVVGDEGHPAHRLRVRLADRSPGRTNPLLEVAARLLDLAGGRATASDVLDLAAADPVRRRFGFTDDDLDQLATWVGQAGIRWGFDAGHRQDFGLASYVQNTWQFGLDRLLTGVTMSEDAGTWLDRTLPLDDVGSGQVDLAGRFAEYVDRLCCVTDELVGTHPLPHWLDALDGGVDALTRPAPGEDWQAAQVARELARVRHAAGQDAAELRLPDVRALLSDRLAGRPTRANFRTGTLTVCTMVPMRSVPHRVICLLGLDDGVFPRGGAVDGDDVLARDPMTGERDARSEDRQLMLDAILAATETLVVTYTGANEYSGHPRPPAVPLGELLDALDATATAGESSVAASITSTHPLQPFDARNVTPGALIPGRPFTFDRTALEGARAAAGERSAVPAFLPQPLAPAPRDDVSLEDLATFLRDPVRYFLRERVDLAVPREDEPLADAIPVELDKLEEWSVADRVMADLLAGLDPREACEREWRRGALPPGRLGWKRLTALSDAARPVAAAARDLRSSPPVAIDIEVDLGDGRRLRGTVPEVYGDRLVPVSYSRLGAKHRLQSWVHVLALAAANPDRTWSAHTIGRPESGRSRLDVATSVLAPDAEAVRDLRGLVELRDLGLVEPLPVPLKASLAYARARLDRKPEGIALRKALWAWQTGRFPGECAEPSHVRVWGDDAPLPGQEPAGADLVQPPETTRFGSLAARLWVPLLRKEEGRW